MRLAVVALFALVGLAMAMPVGPTHQGQVVALTNMWRANGYTCEAYSAHLWPTAHTYVSGGQALWVDRELAAAAQGYAEYMARTGDYRHSREGDEHYYGDAGGQSENIAWLGATTTTYSNGRQTVEARADDRVAQDFVEGWLRSPGHCHNLMQPRWGRIGVGVALSAGMDYYGVQVFARPGRPSPIQEEGLL